MSSSPSPRPPVDKKAEAKEWVEVEAAEGAVRTKAAEEWAEAHGAEAQDREDKAWEAEQKAKDLDKVVEVRAVEDEEEGLSDLSDSVTQRLQRERESLRKRD